MFLPLINPVHKPVSANRPSSLETDRSKRNLLLGATRRSALEAVNSPWYYLSLAVELVDSNQLMPIVYDLKTKEMRLALTNQLIAQLDLRADVLRRQKATLEMCRQDTARIDEQMLYVTEALSTARAIKKKLQVELAADIGAD